MKELENKKEIYREIVRDPQIWKFSFYGLLKNLKFFEPYLYLYLLSIGINLFQIGLLFSVREIITYLFEIPSGILADQYGKKTELLICFIFYIISFVFFFMGGNFFIILIGMVFFGLGEAFRSGTHKAMIYSYLEQKGWFSHKTFVYGRTRSFSLIGSSVSAFVSIIFVLGLPALKWIFLLSILPYILDFLLILSYPNSLNERVETSTSIGKFFLNSINQLKSIFKNKALIKPLLSSSLYDGIFKVLKDYIQPILKVAMAALSISFLMRFDPSQRVKIVLGIVYGVFYIASSWASRNVYRLNKKAPSHILMDLYFFVMGIILLFLGFFISIKSVALIIIFYFILYVMKDSRRPLVVDVLGDYMDKTQRATVLSIESQLRSVIVIVLAPAVGYLADKFSISKTFFAMGIFTLIIAWMLKNKR